MIVIIIQARMGSTRLPGKVLKELNGVPMIKYQVDRVKKSKLADKVVIATSTLPQDDPIITVCMENGIEYFRGSENDVLSRYYECAKKYGADIIVRLTADCPFSDPSIIDDTIRLLLDEKADFSSNTVPPETSTFPDGSDVEVFTFESLQKAFDEAKDPHDREHVTFYLWKYGNDFKTVQLLQENDRSKYRITVDYPEDLTVAQFIAKEITKRKLSGTLKEIIEIIDSNREVKELNSKYFFGIGWK